MTLLTWRYMAESLGKFSWQSGLGCQVASIGSGWKPRSGRGTSCCFPARHATVALTVQRPCQEQPRVAKSYAKAWYCEECLGSHELPPSWSHAQPTLHLSSHACSSPPFFPSFSVACATVFAACGCAGRFCGATARKRYRLPSR